MSKDKYFYLTLIKSCRGFSLVEIMVAMALLLIIVFAFTTLFTFAFGGIFSQGHKSESLYREVQKELEEKYQQGHSDGTVQLAIDFNDPDNDFSVTGKVVSEQYTYQYQSETRTRTIYTFIPNNQ